MATRKAALADARLIFKCETRKHITPEADRAHHVKDLSGKATQAERDKHDHGGCDVHVVHVVPGSAPVSLPPCRTCAKPMVLVEGTLPAYAELPCDARGVIDVKDLIAAQEARKSGR